MFAVDGCCDVWGTNVTEEKVQRCLEQGNLLEIPYQTWQWWGSKAQYGKYRSRHYNHAARIAYFVRNGWFDLIEMDVGCPALGFFPEELVPDGNHRLAAAYYRHNPTIKVDYSGEKDYFNHLFKSPNPKYADF